MQPQLRHEIGQIDGCRLPGNTSFSFPSVVTLGDDLWIFDQDATAPQEQHIKEILSPDFASVWPFHCIGVFSTLSLGFVSAPLEDGRSLRLLQNGIGVPMNNLPCACLAAVDDGNP